MNEPLSKMEWIFRLAMVAVGLAGMAYFANRLLQGQSMRAATRTMPVLRTGPVLEGPGGHGYRYVALSDATWQQARDEASKLRWHGKPGYLATINSAAEFKFIVGTVFALQYPDVTYLGGRQTAPGEWRWVTGPDGHADEGRGRLFWSGYQDGASPKGSFAKWMGPAFQQNGKWSIHNVCCVTIFSYRRPEFSTSLGNGDHDENVSGFLVEFGD